MTKPQHSIPSHKSGPPGNIRYQADPFETHRRSRPINTWLTIGIVVFGLGFLSTMIVTGKFAVTEEPPPIGELLEETMQVAELESPPPLPVVGLVALAAGAFMIGVGLKK